MNKYGLKRKILIDIINKYNNDDNTILSLLKQEIALYDYHQDKRFMPELKDNIQWRQDFLKEEAKKHIKEGDVDFAYKNLFELIRAENPALHGANIYKTHFINESDKEKHEDYYKDEFICEKEKNIIMEMINSIEEKNNVITAENHESNHFKKNNLGFNNLIESLLFGGIFGVTGFFLLIEFLETNNILYIIISVMMFLVMLLILSPFYEKFIFKNNKNIYNNKLNYRLETDKKYNGVTIEIYFNTKESSEHLDEDYKVLEREGIENLIKNQFIPWLKIEQFKDKDDDKIYDGMKVYGISYRYGRIIDRYSPTGHENYFGQFEFSFESSNDYTKDMLEGSVTMCVYVLDDKVVKVSGFDD